jgi:hypothetical protein
MLRMIPFLKKRYRHRNAGRWRGALRHAASDQMERNEGGARLRCAAAGREGRDWATEAGRNRSGATPWCATVAEAGGGALAWNPVQRSQAWACWPAGAASAA